MGGLAIFYGFIVSVACFATIDIEVMGILIGCAIIVTTGVIDDITEMKPIVKLVCQDFGSGCCSILRSSY